MSTNTLNVKVVFCSRGLITSLSRKVAVLDEERAAVIEELEANDRVGRSVMEAFAAAGDYERSSGQIGAACAGR